MSLKFSLPEGVWGNELAYHLLNVASDRPLVLHTRVVSQTGGGPEKTILNSPRFLQRHGYDCLCVYYRDPGDQGFETVKVRAREADAPLIAVDDHGASDFRLVTRLKKLLQLLGGRELIWHGHDYKSNLTGLWLSKRHAMRLVTTVHGWVLKTWKTPLYYAIDRWCLRRFERIICVSQDLYDNCRDMGVDTQRLHWVANAIDLETYQRHWTTAEAKERIGWSAARMLIGSVGRLSPEKGYDLLIDTVASLRSEGQEVGLMLIGEGPERAALEERADRLGVSDQVRFCGFVQDPRVHYQAMDVYAMSSLREGLPNVLLEAMALGVPVIATKIAGIPQLLEEGHGGILVAPGDAGALRAGLKKMLDEAATRQSFIDVGRKLMESRYSFAVRMTRIAGIYDSLGVGLPREKRANF